MAFPRWLSLHGLAENVFVPEAYSYTRDADADRRVHAPLYTHFSGFNMFGLSFSAVALGIARTCIAEFQKLAAEKSPQAAGWAWVLRDNAVVQSKMAQAQAGAVIAVHVHIGHQEGQFGRRELVAMIGHVTARNHRR